MRGACLNVPVLHLSLLGFRYTHLNLFIRASLASGSCGWPYRQTGREHFTSSHTHLQIWVVGRGQGDAQWDRSFRYNVSLEYNQPNSQEIIFTQGDSTSLQLIVVLLDLIQIIENNQLKYPVTLSSTVIERNTENYSVFSGCVDSNKWKETIYKTCIKNKSGAVCFML